MSDHITIIFEQGQEKQTFIVRPQKDKEKPTSTSYTRSSNVSIENTLELLGLEKVPYNELVPKCKLITKENDDSIGQMCSICQEDYTTKEYKRSLTCGHTFHKRCIDKWMRTSPNLDCPYCRKSIK